MLDEGSLPMVIWRDGECGARASMAGAASYQVSLVS